MTYSVRVLMDGATRGVDVFTDSPADAARTGLVLVLNWGKHIRAPRTATVEVGTETFSFSCEEIAAFWHPAWSN